MKSQELILGSWRVQPSLNRLESAQGDIQPLDPKAMEVLVMLLAANGDVVTSDELLDEIWKGRVVEPGVVHQKIRSIRAALADDAKNPTYIETIHKRGYRVIVENAKAREPQGRSHTHYWGIAAGLCLFILLVLWSNSNRLNSNQTNPPIDYGDSIAVAPIRDISPAMDLGWLAQGLSAEIRRQIASWQMYDVLPGPLSRFDTRAAASLPTSYLLDGYVQGTEDEVILALSLLDQRTDSLVWQESFVGNPENPLAMQARVAAEVARYFNQSMGAMTGPTNPTAYQSYLKGIRHSIYGVDQEIYWFEKALAIDPDWKEGWAQLSRAYLQRLYYLGRPDDLRLAKVSLDNTADSSAHFYTLVGYQMHATGNLHASEQLLAERLIAHEDDYSAIYTYARLLMDSGLYVEAEAAYRNFTEVIPHERAVWEALAVLRIHLRNYSGAKAAAKQFARLINVELGNTAYWVSMTNEAMAGGSEDAQILIARHQAELTLLEPGSAWGAAMAIVGFIAEFNFAMLQDDLERATSVAHQLEAHPSAQRVAGMAYLRLQQWEKAAEQFAKAKVHTIHGINFWAFNSLILDSASRSHPLLADFEASMGLTPEWRRELCHRASRLPPSTHISCNIRQFDE